MNGTVREWTERKAPEQGAAVRGMPEREAAAQEAAARETAPLTDAQYAQRLARMLQCRTVSRPDAYDDTEFAKLRAVHSARGHGRARAHGYLPLCAALRAHCVIGAAAGLGAFRRRKHRRAGAGAGRAVLQIFSGILRAGWDRGAGKRESGSLYGSKPVKWAVCAF